MILKSFRPELNKIILLGHYVYLILVYKLKLEKNVGKKKLKTC